MNWDAIGAVAEALGAAGVIITLVFLVRQLQQNTGAVRASTGHAIAEAYNQINLRLGLDPDAVDLLMRGARNRDDLSPHERVRHTLFWRALVGIFQDIHVQFCEGMCDSETWELAKLGLLELVSTPPFAAWWEREQVYFRSGFRSEVDALIRATQQDAAS